MAGTPKINIDYLSTGSTFCQYNFQVYEVSPGGVLNFVNRLNYTDRNYSANTRRTKYFDGQAHAHVFKAGNKIRVVLTNLDTAPIDFSFLGTNPFVLPVIVNSTNYLYLGTGSYIDIPLVGSSSFANEYNKNINLPYQFSLKQNYPNPFNPSTLIEYSIASSGNVELKVYDILGREVKTLVNNFMQPGSYNVSFDASALSSGVYFYKIVSGNYTAVRRMVLVK